MPSEKLRAAVVWMAGFALVMLVLHGALALAAKILAVAASGLWPFAYEVLGSWRTILLAAMLLTLVGLCGIHPNLPSRAELRRHRRRWLIGTLACLAVVGARGFRHHVSVNELGLMVDDPSSTFWVDRGHPTRPPALVTTNALGFRDDAWVRGPTGKRRVLIVGDSYVYGKGIPDAEGLIDRQLERELLRIDPTGRWEVMNAGFPGWGYFTYFDAARRLLREFRPRVVIVASLGISDWDLLDYQQQLERFGGIGLRVLATLGVAEELKEASVLYARRLAGTPTELDRALGSDVLRRDVELLLADAERLDADVVLWDYYVPIPYFDAFADQPRFHRAGWPDGFDRRWDGWGQDPRVAIPGDRHPTEQANAIISGHLAPQILALVRGSTSPAAAVP